METTTKQPKPELLHTEQDINYFNDLAILADQMIIIAEKYNDQTLLKTAKQYKNNIQSELNKYDYLIGTVCFAPPSSLSNSKEYRIGVIEGGFYFNPYSKSVRCIFRYGKNGINGFDTHAIRELKTLEELEYKS